jgi:hypothetical protein
MYTVHRMRYHSREGHHDLDSIEDLLMDHAPEENVYRLAKPWTQQDAYTDWPTFGTLDFGHVWMTKYVPWANIRLS